MSRLARRLGTVVTAAALVAGPAATLSATSAGAAVPAISAAAFGMHWLDGGHPYPATPFGSARLWGGTVPTWAQLQPTGPTSTTDLLGNVTWTPAQWDQGALARLDAMVNTYVSHHVDPMITLGMTPEWAANNCQHVDSTGRDWGLQTCAPVPTAADGTDPWAAYVTFLAQRYQGKVHYFELWNEPSLHNGYNDDIGRLAAMQQQAYSILHSYGAKLVSPSIAFTNGSPNNGLSWMRTFFSKPGGIAFDVTGLHLYPNDTAVKGGYGPEWAMNTALAGAKKVLAQYGLSGRQIWNTETNVGRIIAHTVVGGGTAGAANVARTFILATQNKIARTMWYAADDRTWGGTWLENTDYRTLTAAGNAERAVRNLLVGKAPLGCTRTTVGTNKWKYTCRFGTTTGKKRLMAIWTTGSNYRFKAPAGTKAYYTVTGAKHSASKGKKFSITHTPIYLVGSFK